MSLTGALNVGRTALTAHQTAIQVSGNNIANVNTPGYTRQVAKLAPNPDQRIGPELFIGTGVNVESITRAIDESLNSRLRGAVSDGEGAEILKQWIGRVEAAFNELSDEDLSTRLSAFFNSWSNLANKPQDLGLRQIVLQSGESVATWMRDLRASTKALAGDVDERLVSVVESADALAKQVADLNVQIVQAEGGGGGPANGLRDQRDVLLQKLSELVNVQTKQQDSGAINVYVNSVPLVLEGTSRGVALRQENLNGELVRTVTFKADDGEMNVTSGQLGGLSAARETIGTTIETLDKLAGNLIFELNKIHAAGQGLEGHGSLQGGFAVADVNVALSSEDAQLKFTPSNGSFVVHVKNKQTGLSTSTLIQLDLDGLNGNDTTLSDLAASLDGVTGISANTTGNRLNLSADSEALEFSFSQDSAGVLAALGVNGFFSGSDAGDIAVNAAIKSRPTLLAAAKNGEPGDNQTALAIARLESASVAGLGNISLKNAYEGLVNDIAAQAARSQSDAEAADTIRETLSAQREALSGVSLDEEAVNLLKSQRAFQGAARVVAVVDELLQTILSIVR
jgi:flagellar hook-associated protein 1 FlgK